MGIKTPLTLGITVGGILLAHAVTAPRANALETCTNDGDCGEGETCEVYLFERSGKYWDPTRQEWVPYSTWYHAGHLCLSKTLTQIGLIPPCYLFGPQSELFTTLWGALKQE